MRFTYPFRITLLVLGLAFIAAPAALRSAETVNLIVNGSFEMFNGTRTDAGGTVTQITFNNAYKLKLNEKNGTNARTSTTALPGWTTTRVGDDFAWIANASYTRDNTLPDGKWCVCITGATEYSPESIFQSFAVVAGTKYTVSYYTKYRFAGGHFQSAVTAASGKLTLTASLGGVLAGDGASTLTQTTGSATGDWTLYSFTFTPSEDTTVTLTFKSAESGTSTSAGAFLDNVVVNSPEPSTTVMMVSGVTGENSTHGGNEHAAGVHNHNKTFGETNR